MSSDDDDVPLARNGRAKTKRQTAGEDSDVSMFDGEPKDSPAPASTKARLKAKARGKHKVASDSDSDSDDDDAPLASSQPVASAAIPMPGALAATTKDAPAGKAKAKPAPKSRPTVKRVKEEAESEEDAPPPKKKAKASAAPKKRVKAESDVDASEEDDAPLAKKKGKAPPKKKVKAEEDEEDVKPAKGKKGKAKKEDDEGEEQVFRWWEISDAQGDGSDKWQTLVHSGVLFPPLYETLPKNVKMKYDGKEVDLPPESEEVAGFYAALMETDHAKDATFNKNFFNDWQKVLAKYPPKNKVTIKDLDKCDFRPMYEHFEAEKAKKKSLTSADKKAAKAAKDALEAPYAACTLDGRTEKVGNFRVEPPGLFRGRGEHPRKGSLKLRVNPEDITINIGEGETVPVPNMPGKWKKVIHDKTVTWLATWTENVNGNNKYVFLAAGSSLKGQSDMAKFEKARELKKHVDRIRQDYTSDLKNKVMADRQRATTMYFIDKLALRAGNEKGEEEADTFGCCSLRCSHVTLEQPNFVVFDFLGKDSIRYYKRVPVDTQVFKNIRIFKENKADDDDLFDRVTTSGLNKHLTSYMKGLTAKVFRTYNASITFQQQLDEGTPEKGATVQEKLNAYNKANRMVAILCNHQRSVPKTHEASMGKMREKIRGLKYEKMKLRHVLCTLEPKYKKKAKYATAESDIDDEWVAAHETELEAKEVEKVEKKFEKDNEKRAADGDAPLKQGELDERVAAVREEYKRLRKEQGTGKATLKRERPVEKLEEAIGKLEERIAAARLQMVDREEGKEVALTTSKINYLDPRITAAWCKEHDVPIEKLFSKTLITKFPWALQADEEWKF